MENENISYEEAERRFRELWKEWGTDMICCPANVPTEVLEEFKLLIPILDARDAQDCVDPEDR